MSEKPKLTIYARLLQANLSGEGTLILELKKDNTAILSALCRIMRETFLGKDVYVYITSLDKEREVSR